MSKSKTKLVSLNMGISLVVLKDGKEEKMSYSLRCPSKSFDQPIDALEAICEFINDEFGTTYGVSWETPELIRIVRAKAIKAPAPVGQDEFNKRIKELVG